MKGENADVSLLVLAAGLHCVPQGIGIRSSKTLLSRISDSRDWSVGPALLQAIRPHKKLLPMLDRMLREVPEVAQTMPGLAAHASTFTEAVRVINSFTFAEAHDVARHLGEHAPLTQFFKGIQLCTYYDRDLVRSMWDIDLISSLDTLDHAVSALQAAGYEQGYMQEPTLVESGGSVRLNLTPTRGSSVRWIRDNHHQLHPFFKLLDVTGRAPNESLWPRKILRHGERVYLLLDIDLHFNLASGMAQEDVFFGDARPFELSGEQLPGVSAEIYVFFLCGRTYYEPIAFRGRDIRYFVDLMTILSKFKGDLDWDRVFYLGEKYGSFAALYYGLMHANRLSDGQLVPERVIARAGRDLLANRKYDLGDFMPRLLDTLALTAPGFITAG